MESTSPVTAGASALEQAPPSTSPARLSRFFRSSALRTSEEEAAASTVGKAISISTQDHNIATSISIDEALDWSVDDVCKWLEQNGLNQLQNKFKGKKECDDDDDLSSSCITIIVIEVHDIDGNVLFELGHSALKDMGVQRVGDRMRVLLCVKRLRQGVRFVKRDGLAAATTETATPTNGSKLLRKFSLIMPRGSSADRPANENATNDDRSTLAARQRSKKPSPISTGLSLLNSSSPLTSTTSSGSSSFLYRTGSPIEDAAASAAEAQAKLPPRPSSMAMAPPSLVYSSPGVLFERISTIQRRESRALSTGASPVSSIGHHTSRSVTPLASPPITAESLALLAKEDDPEQEEEQQKAVARNTTSPPSPSTIIMTYDSVRRNCIRVVGPEYVTHIINIGDLLDDVHAIKLRIMEHFQITNAFEQTQYRIAFLQHGINKEPLPVNDDELLEICRSTDRPEKERLLLHRPEVTRTLHRQSTIGRLSRLFTSSTLISGKSKMHSSGTTLNVQRPPTPPPHKQEPTQKRFSPSKRPPSQIISHNLGLFFPATFDKPIATSLHEATTAGSSVASAAAVLVSDDHVKTIEYLVQKRASSNSAKRRQSGASVHASLNEPSSARNLQRRSVDQGKSMINRLDGTMRRNSDVPVRFRQSQWSVVAQEAFQPPLRSPDSRRWSLFLKRQSRLVATDDNIDSHALRPPTINTDLATLNKATLVDTPTDGDPIECETGLRNWIKGDLIGRGSFASVFYGVNPITGEIMAVKQVELPSAKSSSLRIGRSGRSSDRRAKMVKALQLEIELLKTVGVWQAGAL